MTNKTIKKLVCSFFPSIEEYNTHKTEDDIQDGLNFVPFTGGEALKQTNGWYKTTEGLIVQWGIATDTNDALQTRSFNITFPNECLIVIGSIKRNLKADEWPISIGDWTTTNFNFYVGSRLPFIWLAIGY